jgi:hypothetical protein
MRQRCSCDELIGNESQKVVQMLKRIPADFRTRENSSHDESIENGQETFCMC